MPLSFNGSSVSEDGRHSAQICSIVDFFQNHIYSLWCLVSEQCGHYWQTNFVNTICSLSVTTGNLPATNREFKLVCQFIIACYSGQPWARVGTLKTVWRMGNISAQALIRQWCKANWELRRRKKSKKSKKKQGLPEARTWWLEYKEGRQGKERTSPQVKRHKPSLLWLFY